MVRNRNGASIGPITTQYIRVRFAQLVIATAILIVGSWVLFSGFKADIIIPVLVGLILPVLFSEPYFTGPKTALVASIALVASYFSSDHSETGVFWNVLIGLGVVVFMSAVIAMDRKQKPGQLFHWISTHLGRASILGSLATIIIALQVASEDIEKLQWLVIIFIAVFICVVLDWPRLALNPSKNKDKVASILELIAPNQLLVSTYANIEVGSKIRLGTTKGSSFGYVAEDLASTSGRQYRIVLSSHWSSVADSANMPCVITKVDADEKKVVGFAIEGSTESTVRLNPSRRLEVGQTFEMEGANGPLLYQVTSLNLEEENWSGSAAVVPRARLMQVGSADETGKIVARPSLPEPYSAVFEATDVSTELDDSYMKIGVLKGTSVPVGIKKGWASNDGHLAILGMSGMGKTTTAARLAGVANGEDILLVLDETSEYRTRLGFDPTPQASLDLSSPGITVCEPAGELTQISRDIIKNAMTAASAEYQAGNLPRRRYLLLEEAHGYLPEWNFLVNRNHGDNVNESARYILQARKFNLTFILVSQRTAVISKSALSQCENYIIFRTLDQTSLEYVEGLVGYDLKGLIPELGRYEAICVGPIFNSDSPIIVSLDPAVVPTE